MPTWGTKQEHSSQVSRYPITTHDVRVPKGLLAATSQSNLQGAATSKPSEVQGERLVCWGKASAAASIAQMGMLY